MKYAICTLACDRGLGMEVLDRHLTAIRVHDDLRDAEVYLGLQEFSSDEARALKDRYGLTDILHVKHREPPFFMRQLIVTHAKTDADFWVFLDDDLFVTERTRIAPMANCAMGKGVGLVTGDYRRNEASYRAVVERHHFRRSPILMLGGGMVFRRGLAPLVVRGSQPYRFDDSQYCLNLYLEGYENYLYQGSVALHSMFPGGLRKTSYEIEFASQDPRWIRTRPNKASFKLDNSYFITETKDLTVAAKAYHEANKRRVLRRMDGLV